MTADDFDFELPAELIAQRPADKRDASRLLVVSRADGAFRHAVFSDVLSLLKAGDVLVLNDARVIPARLLGKKAGTGGRAELLLVRPAAGTAAGAALEQGADELEWLCLGQASKGLKPGTRIELDGGLLASVSEALGGGEYRVRFSGVEGSLAQAIERAGRLPLPPYIDRAPDTSDAERYQTVYAKALGSVAAPTAGLHFTPQMLAAAATKGVEQVTVTLDVGPGTFMPVREGDLSAHVMHAERCHVGDEAARRINQAKNEKRRVVAVGTTVVRTLESMAKGGQVAAGSMATRLFITPGFQFQMVDALLTNFHLPKSTLVMLVAAFLGKEQTLAAYRAAVAERYRFFSYGDAMFIS